MRQIQWLGFNLDFDKGVLSVPEAKICRLRESIEWVLNQRSVKVRVLASIVGRIISMGPGLGPVSRLMTRSLYELLRMRVSWQSSVCLRDSVVRELRFWGENVERFNCTKLWVNPAAVRVVYSDASDQGYGGYVVEHGQHVAQGHWDPAEAAKSSTWRELRAVKLTLLSLVDQLRGQRVRWFTDSMNVSRILLVGSRKPELQQDVLSIFASCFEHGISLEPQWIPRELNSVADALSRVVDYDDWQLDPRVFQVLDQWWGPHTVDRFASYYNRQLPRFNSRFAMPGSEAVDAFTADWGGENNWWCPPICLVPRLLQHARQCAAVGTLIVPMWLSAPFWPILCPTSRGGSLAEYVRAWCDLPRYEGLFMSTRSGAALFEGRVPNTRVLALRVEFSHQ